MLENLAVGTTKDRQQHAGMASVRQRIPVDVKRHGIRGLLSPFEHVEPPQIVSVADAHMVGHEIEDQFEVISFQRGAQTGEAFLSAELGIDLVVIDDVVAVRAARPRLEKRRSIEMRDAELPEIRRERGGRVEIEIPGELQPIGCQRHH